MSEKANFSNIYKFYDLINTVLTFGFDKSWREKAVSNLIGNSVLDLGSGTGAAYKQLLNFETTAYYISPFFRTTILSRKLVVGSNRLYYLRSKAYSI